MPIKSMAMISVHTSPLAKLGGEKTGGMNVYINELAGEFGQRGLAVDIYTRRRSARLPEVDTSLGENVRVIHLSAGPEQPLSPEDVYPHLSQFTASLLAFSTLQHTHYDFVFSHYWLSGMVANKLKEISGTPFAQMFHTLGHMKNRISPGKPPALLPDIRVASETRIMQWADAIVASTPAEQAQLLWLYRADRRKIIVAPPGVNTQQFYPLPMDEAKRQLHFPHDVNLLLFVGRIEPLKAVDTILHALNVLRKSSPELVHKTRFMVIGGNPDNPKDSEISRLKTLVAELGLYDVVQFLGAKDQSELRNYYSASTAVLMPSDYESFGMVALEAMASGTPVIASQVGGLAFLIEDGRSGYLVPVRDSVALAERIRELLSDPLRQRELRRGAAERAAHYTWPATADSLLAHFEQITNPPTPAFSHRKR